jgi:hypothetical protein
VTGLTWLTYDDFADRIGEDFVVTAAADEPLTLELVDAVEGSAPGGTGPDGRQRRQFSLVFRGPGAPVLGQGSRGLVHHAIGELELFLVPIGPDAVGMRYEAVFA